MLKELIVDDYGVNLSKKSERLIIKKDGKVIEEIAIKELEDLIITSKCGVVSIALLEELITNGTQIHFVNYKEEPFITAYTPALHGSIKARREQLLSYHDERGVLFIKECITTKIQNQINVIKYFLKSRKELDVANILKEEIQGMKKSIKAIEQLHALCIDDIRLSIDAYEGQAAKRYWKCVRFILEDKIDFPSRKPRSKDIVNMMLDYGYAILRSRVTSSIIRSGLEPYGGFLHVDRSGRPSLVLDFMEIFRPAVVDRAIISILTRGFQPKLEEKEDGQLFMNKPTLSTIRDYINKRLNSREEFQGKDYMVKTIIQMQARMLSSFFKREGEFKGHTSRW
ncbi:CRISPR-associated endonuclease Cas1 [Calidifontibacillus oryziterrae]|uniref:CRISPR-associated endonuclease Cas1 n=1 Tax=Calidifontibacillus oryziterrae TaxID=1191699 RepID=UPI0002F28412|nr:CRISPR-associated endonuclease Cas1 [Calidifontibacillus oryziterrae]